MIDRKLFDEYARALSTVADMAQSAIEALWDEVSGLPDDEARRELEELYGAALDRFGGIAALVALEFYAANRAQAVETSASDQGKGRSSDGSAAGALPAYEPDTFMPDFSGTPQRDVRDAVKKSGNRMAAVDYLAKQGVRRVGECADETMYQNAFRDPANPKWAFVPRVGACGWCVMQGGHGFRWPSEATANKLRHPNCKCSVVADFDTRNPALKGYDPDKMAKSYSDCERSVRADAEAKWAQMSDAERDGYKNFDHYLRNRTVAEMNMRIARDKRIEHRIESSKLMHSDFCPSSADVVRAERVDMDKALKREWNEYIKLGKTEGAYATTVGRYVEGLSGSGRLHVDPFVDLKIDKGKEVQLAKWFADAGHEVLLRASLDGDTNDALIDSVAWEFKRVTSSNPGKITKRVMEKVPRQGPRFVIDLSESVIALTDAERKVAELLERVEVGEIMLVHSGSLRLFVK